MAPSTSRFEAQLGSAPGGVAKFFRQFTPAMWLLTALGIVGFAGDLLRYTVTWTGYGIAVVALVGVTLFLLRSRWQQLRSTATPITLTLFLAWCGLSLLWSEYRIETAVAWFVQVTIAFLAFATTVLLDRDQFLQALGAALRLIVIGSLIFELGVALFTGDGLIPPAYLYGRDLDFFLRDNAPQKTPDAIPSTLYWSFGHLLEGGTIQGLPGNRNLLAMVALFAVVITITQLIDKKVHRIYGLIFIVLALYTLWRTRSATSLVAAAFMVLGVVLVYFGRRIRRTRRWALYLVVGTALVTSAALVIKNYTEVFALMNRSSDMSGRGDIWRSVVEFAEQRPIIGHGWISYWVPWLPQFDDLGVVGTTAHQQAHNAFLDVWMQTGFIGVTLFATFVFATLVRTWWNAIDHPDDSPLTATHAVGFILAIGLVVQSMTESRLLVEGYWFLICALAFASRQHHHELPSTQPIRQVFLAASPSEARRGN